MRTFNCSSELLEGKVGENKSVYVYHATTEMWDKAGVWKRAFRSLNNCLCLNSWREKWSGKNDNRCLLITYLVAWLAAAEWVKPAGEMFGLAWSHDNVLGVGSFFIWGGLTKTFPFPLRADRALTCHWFPLLRMEKCYRVNKYHPQPPGLAPTSLFQLLSLPKSIPC